MKFKKDAKVIEYSPTKELLDETFIAKAVWECLKNNDPEGVLEIIETHLEIVHKVKNAQKNKSSCSIMHDVLKDIHNALKDKNPTLNTLAKTVNSFSDKEDIKEDCCV